MVIIFIRFFERHRCIEDSRFERGRKIHRWVSQRESLKIGERKEGGHNFMPHFSAGKSLRGSHKSFAVWGRRAAPRSSSRRRRRLFSSVSVLSPLHFTSHHSRLKEFLPSPWCGRGMKFMSGQNRNCGKPLQSPLFLSSFLPSFLPSFRFRIVEWSNDINESKERRSGREKFFHFGDLSLLQSGVQTIGN